jgi:hypothetical protein
MCVWVCVLARLRLGQAARLQINVNDPVSRLLLGAVCQQATVLERYERIGCLAIICSYTASQHRTPRCCMQSPVPDTGAGQFKQPQNNVDVNLDLGHDMLYL